MGEQAKDIWRRIRGKILSITKYGDNEIGSSLGSGTHEGFVQNFGSNLLDKPKSIHLMMKTGTGKNTREINLPILP